MQSAQFKASREFCVFFSSPVLVSNGQVYFRWQSSWGLLIIGLISTGWPLLCWNCQFRWRDKSEEESSCYDLGGVPCCSVSVIGWTLFDFNIFQHSGFSTFWVWWFGSSYSSYSSYPSIYHWFLSDSIAACASGCGLELSEDWAWMLAQSSVWSAQRRPVLL